MLCKFMISAVLFRETERRLEEERLRNERLTALKNQLELQKAKEIFTYQQDFWALQNAQEQIKALVRLQAPC